MYPMTVCSYKITQDVKSVKMSYLQMDFILQVEMPWPENEIVLYTAIVTGDLTYSDFSTCLCKYDVQPEIPTPIIRITHLGWGSLMRVYTLWMLSRIQLQRYFACFHKDISESPAVHPVYTE